MGHKHSIIKVNAKIKLHYTKSTVDSLTLSYKSNSCFGGRRVVATFSFFKGGWQQVSEDVLQNSSSKGVKIPLERLRKKDGGTSVRITCLAGNVPVYATQLALADLLERLRCTVRGKEALLLFSLTGGKAEGDEAQGNAFTALFCNGRRCGEAPRVEAPMHPPPAEGVNEEDDGERLEDNPGPGGDGPGFGENGNEMEGSPGHGGDGLGLDDSRGLEKDSDGVGDSPGHGGDGQGLETSPDLGQDDQPGEEEAITRQPTPHAREGRYNEEVPASPHHYVATPSSYGSGGRGRGTLINTLRVCAVVVAYILLLYNAWLEWNST